MRNILQGLSRRKLIVGGLVILAAAIGASYRVLQGETTIPAGTAPTSMKADPFIVHEWGTFTSFSGADGVQLDFRPNVANELPAFVETRQHHAAAGLSKSLTYAKLRMETPVTYFYTDRQRDVDVKVQFKQGVLTEFYPPPKEIGPAGFNDVSTVKESFLDWGRVHLIPQNEFSKAQVSINGGKYQPAKLPAVSGDDHYGLARETDSAIVAAKDQFDSVHLEKFLFYRGVGKFKLPISLEAKGDGRFSVTNFGGGPIRGLFLVHIENGQVRYRQAATLAANGVIYLQEPQADSTIDDLAVDMVCSLVEAGLYEKEARAMVNTWRSSWFGEEGTRLLYLVPQPLTDTLLPLTIKPAPEKLVRVLVGRMEVMTPEREQKLRAAIEGMGTCFAATLEPIRSELESLGRFAEPALERLVRQSSDCEFKAAAEKLMAVVRGTP